MRRKMFLMLTISLSALIFSTTALAQQKFTVSAIGAQEVPAVNSAGRGTCLVTLNTAETQITVNCTYSGLGTNVVGAHIHIPGAVGVNGPVVFNFQFTGGTSGTIGPLTFSPTPAQVADLRAKRWYVNIHTTQFTDGEIRGQVKPATMPFDFDGDGRTDIKVLRSTDSAFYTLNSINNSVVANFFAGTTTINSSSTDFDGDGRGDFIILSASGTTRFWSILQTATNTVRELQFGLTTDQALPADYDGDGKTDIAVFRRTNGMWFIVRSSDNQMQAIPYGAANDIGMVGDFDKDGTNDLTVIRGGFADGNAWITRRSSDNMNQTIFFGGATAPAGDTVFTNAQIDIDGDGRQDHMIVRDPDSGTTGSPIVFYIRRSSDSQQFAVQWGIDTDSRLYGDYDGDGRTDFVSRRNIGGELVWLILLSSNNYNRTQQRTVGFGATGDVLVEQPEENVSSINLFDSRALEFGIKTKLLIGNLSLILFSGKCCCCLI